MNVPYQRVNGDAFAELGSVGSETLPVMKLETLNRCRGRVGTNVRSFRALKVVIGALLLVLVLSSAVVSKLTLISMTSRLGSALVDDEPGAAVSLYWQLLFVIMVPQCVTFVRTMLRGVCGKRTSTFPWPTFRALLVGIVSSTVEVIAMTCLVFLVLTHLPKISAIFIMNGIFMVQAVLDLFRVKCWELSGRGIVRCLHAVLENKISRIVGIGLQVGPILAAAGYIGWATKDVMLPVTLPLCLLVISAVWSTGCQRLGTKASARTRPEASAHNWSSDSTKLRSRYKSNFINSGIRIILYPVVSYIIFRYALTHNRVDPWCLHESCSLADTFKWPEKDMALFFAQILGSFLGYIFAWISCCMGLHRWGLAVPLFLCTPISVAICVGVMHYDKFELFPESLVHVNHVVSSTVFLLWLGQMLVVGFSIWKEKNVILAKDSSMFVSPHYDGVLLEQQILLNRKVEDVKKKPKKKEKKTVFVCSTMYREDSDEMEQMLSSIHNLACYYSEEKDKNQDPETCDHFESHVFFDGGVNGDSLTHFALQLVSLLEKSLSVDIKGMPKIQDTLRIQDNTKIKNKKRWSQVMYMNYVLNHRIPSDTPALNGNSTFILTTDADIRFTAESAVVLLDMLDSDPQVGAVCARTHPQGSGLLYWYQVFDYAIVFLETYSTEVSNSKATEFLTKDMGEDRWLCTLLVEKGWRLEYCAVSENHTHCPEDFDTFYKQRRRWIPSTVANLSLLITQASEITRGNDTVSVLFVLFQAVLVFSTAISPATVILVIASGFASAYKVSDSAVIALIVLLLLLSIAYGLFCIYGKPQHQLDVAKFASLILVIFMGVVFAGNLKNMIYDAVTLIKDCSKYEACMNAANGTFMFPLTPSTMYLTLFTLLFIIAGLVHFNEFSCLIHGVWYFLALPSGYLLLLIYSVANLDDRSWGTREASSAGGQGGGVGSFKKYLDLGLNKIVGRWTNKTPDVKENRPPDQSTGPTTQNGIALKVANNQVVDDAVRSQYEILVNEREFMLSDQVRQWLADVECPLEYVDLFERHGYFKLSFIAGMTAEDLKFIGIQRRGYILRLEKAAKDLPPYCIISELNCDENMNVGIWLQCLELHAYRRLFESAGYKTRADLENLKGLTEEDLQRMGIHMRAHLGRLKEGIGRLSYLHNSQFKLQQDVVQWLRNNGCVQYTQHFEREGYFNSRFIAGLKSKDFEAIGITERGLRLRLERAAKTLPAFVIQKGIPLDVGTWLESLEMQGYQELFAAAGYQTKGDLESLKGLKADDLKKLGILKKAHLQRLVEGIDRLTYATEGENKVHDTKTILQGVTVDSADVAECAFWESMLDVGQPLRPIEASFKSDAELKEALKALRNATLAVLLLINIMWIVLLYTLQFPELVKYNLPSKAFEALFLAVYALIILVQFGAMIAHRGVTLVHYLARVESTS
ncbi:hypothetical protein EMCRGX_G012610 [Ephydatia muelleri]